MSKEFFNSTQFNLILAVILGVIISYIDLNNDEVQAPVLFLLIFTFILGFRHPEKAWLYSLILGSSIFLGNYFAELINFTPADPNVNLSTTWIALIPAFIRGYLGALVKFVLNKVIS